MQMESVTGNSLCVCTVAEEGEEVVFVDEAGGVVSIAGPTDSVGETVAAVELRDPSGHVTQCVSGHHGSCIALGRD